MTKARILKGIWIRRVPWMSRRGVWRTDIAKTTLADRRLQKAEFVLSGGPIVIIPANELRHVVRKIGRTHYRGGKIWGPFGIDPLQHTVEGHRIEMTVRKVSRLPEEIPEPERYFAGSSREITVNAYERDPRARSACIRHYGPVCAVCDLRFEEKYGERVKGFIHVHHVVPLSQIDEGYAIDPVKDLIPVCPNCHAMLHYKCKTVFTVDELKKSLKRPNNRVEHYGA